MRAYEGCVQAVQVLWWVALALTCAVLAGAIVSVARVKLAGGSWAAAFFDVEDYWLPGEGVLACGFFTAAAVALRAVLGEPLRWGDAFALGFLIMIPIAFVFLRIQLRGLISRRAPTILACLVGVVLGAGVGLAL